jgi:hypothetical protein
MECFQSGFGDGDHLPKMGNFCFTIHKGHIGLRVVPDEIVKVAWWKTPMWKPTSSGSEADAWRTFSGPLARSDLNPLDLLRSSFDDPIRRIPVEGGAINVPTPKN